MFSHSLLYPPRPVSSLLDARLVLPAGAPSVRYPPGAQTATLPLFAAPPLSERDATTQLVRHSALVNDRPCPLTSVVTAERFTDAATFRSQWMHISLVLTALKDIFFTLY